MSRLHRPHIPLRVRCLVAMRQLCVEDVYSTFEGHRLLGRTLADLLEILLRALRSKLNADKLELHHRPALVNRRRKRNGEYIPAANDPNFLLYLSEADHDVETRVRGQHGQLSDLALRRKNKRIARKRSGKRSRKITQRKNPWPPKGSRKFLMKK